MEKIESLVNITLEKIETDIMSILYANLDIEFDNNQLFNKLILDKYDLKLNEIKLIPKDFKSKFLIVFNNLYSNYNDLEIKKSNFELGKYYIICYSDPKNINCDNIKKYDNDQYKYKHISGSDYKTMFDYIYQTNVKEFYNWVNHANGNSIYHDLIEFNNVYLIDKLIYNNKFNFEIKNLEGETPLDAINNLHVGKNIIRAILDNLNDIKSKYEDEKNKYDSIFNLYCKQCNTIRSFTAITISIFLSIILILSIYGTSRLFIN